MSGREFSPPTTRYTPLRYHPSASEYVRSLVTGRLHRIRQVCGDQDYMFFRGVYEMMHELSREPNNYPVRTLRKALFGVRFAPAREALRHAKAALHELDRIAKD